MAISKISGSGIGAINAPVEFTSADNLAQLTLSSTDADANQGPRLKLRRNSASPADNDLIGVLEWTSENSDGTEHDFLDFTARMRDVTAGSEDVSFAWTAYLNGTGREIQSFVNTDASAASMVFNEDSQDIDFRVESNGNANMLFVDGGTDAVGIGRSTKLDGSSAMDHALHINAGTGGNLFSCNRGANGLFNTFMSTTGTAGIAATGSSGSLEFRTGTTVGTSTIRMTVESAGDVTIEDGNLVIGTSGHGISFAATGDGAGTDTSELLDDYEEGTFTPVLKDDLSGNAAGSSASSGRYTKIGRVVNFSFAIEVNSLSGMTAGNGLNVTGLPYTVNNNSAGGGEPHAQILAFINNLDSADYAGSIILRPNNNTTVCELKYTAAGAVTSQGGTSLLVQDIAANTYLNGSATYETT